MSHTLSLSERNEGNVIDHTIKYSRKLLCNALQNTWLFKYSQTEVRKKGRKKKEGRRRGREGRKGALGGREGGEGRKGKKIVLLNFVLIPRCLEAPHGVFCILFLGLTLAGRAGRTIFQHKLFMQNFVKSHSCFLAHLVYSQ